MSSEMCVELYISRFKMYMHGSTRDGKDNGKPKRKKRKSL